MSTYDENPWAYRLPFIVYPSNLWAIGNPGDHHMDIPMGEADMYWQQTEDFNGVMEDNSGQYQGQIIFHPEEGAIIQWPYGYDPPDEIKGAVLNEAKKRWKAQSGWAVASKAVKIDSGIDPAHADTPKRIPWIWSPELNTLFVGDGGSSHLAMMRLMRDLPDTVFDNMWQGVYASGSEMIVIHSQYDVNQFNEADIDPQLIAELWMSWPEARAIMYLDHDREMSYIKKSTETYMGWPKFERGDHVILLGYGDKGIVDSAKWDEDEEIWWYRVKMEDWVVPGATVVHEYPETDLERASVEFDQGKAIDEPSAWTLKDFGLPPEAEDYYRTAAAYDMMNKMAVDQTHIDSIQRAFASDKAARVATDALTAAGGRVYIVGGAVRDAFLGRDSKDVDLMVVGMPGDAIEQALSPLGRVDLTGKAFGVYRFKTNGFEVEIALPRTEQSTGAGHKDFEVKTDPNLSPEEDLQRRDFTGNAMAFDPLANELIDPHGGADDLQAGRLRLVNDHAFKDDPLRIVRALVANARFGLEPDPDLKDSLAQNAHRLKSLPGERIQMELDKLLAGNNPAQAFKIAEETGLIDYMVPELSAAIGFDQMNPHHNLDVFSHTMQVLTKAAQLSNDPDFRLAALFHDSGKPDSFWRDEDAPEGGGGHFYKKIMDDGTEKGQNHEEVGAELVEAFMNRLRYPKKRTERVKTLVANHMFPYFKTTGGARKFLAALDGDTEMAFDLLKLRESDASGKSSGEVSEYDRSHIDRARALLEEVIADKSALRVTDLALNGHDLMQLGLKGRQIGEAQKKLLELVIDSPELNNREDLMSIVSDGIS